MQCNNGGRRLFPIIIISDSWTFNFTSCFAFSLDEEIFAQPQLAGFCPAAEKETGEQTFCLFSKCHKIAFSCGLTLYKTFWRSAWLGHFRFVLLNRCYRFIKWIMTWKCGLLVENIRLNALLYHFIISMIIMMKATYSIINKTFVNLA